MTTLARTRAKEVLRVLSVTLVLFVLILRSGESPGASAAPGGSGTRNSETVSGQSDVRALRPSSDWDWPQVQRDPQRTGYSPEILNTDFGVIWTYPFQPEKVYPQVQAIIYSGKAFVGTQMGNLYALNTETGAQEWVHPVGAPILNSVAAGEGKVFFGAMDGAVYAVDAATGLLAWRAPLLWRHGFSTAPVLAEGKVMLGGRNGRFYALDAVSGETIWCWPPEDESAIAPILQTAAWNDRRVFFGAMDMHLYSIDTAAGQLAWRSGRIPGMAFKDYWPVVHNGMVYIRPMGMGALGVEDRTMVIDPAAQQAVLADYEANPEDYEITLRRFIESTGEEGPIVIHYSFQTMNGATSPPCVDRNGHLAIPAPYPESGTYQTGWARLDVRNRILVDVLHDGTNAGYGNQDENMNLTCTGNLIIAMHTQEYNAQYTGAYDLDHQSWTRIPAGHISRQMSTNTQGGGGNPASVANGVVYHISFHELIARRTQQ